MPNINDIVLVAEALEKSPVAVLRDRCVAVRNRNATCRRCVQACQADAIDISANEIHLDAGACVSCGACTAVCPTEALVPARPLDPELTSATAEATAANDGLAVFACARISSKHLADPLRYAEVPCLARVEESILVDLVAHGASDVLLVDGTCSTCRYRACVPSIDDVVLNANTFIAAHGGAARVQRVSEFPQDMLVDDAQGLFGSTRRGFFAEAAGAAKDTALTAAKATIAQDLGLIPEEEAIGVRLRVDASGVMPRLNMPRHETLINAMDAIGAPVAAEIESRRFASVAIDVEKCNACGMCAVFCPSGALERGDGGKASSDIQFIEFSASECVQCGLCVDVCWKGALALSTTVSTDQLFDFEPVTFDLASVKRLARNSFGKA